MDGAARSAEGEATVQHAREGELLRKWCSGRVLAPGEAAELARVLPPAVLADPPMPRAYYAHEYDHYAALLNCGVRNIKRYVALGREAKPEADFPPFDDPPKFLGWWERRMRRRPPADVLTFVRHGHTVGVVAAGSIPPPVTPAASVPSAAGRPTASTPPADPTKAPGFEDAGAGGFEQSVRALRATVASSQKRLRDAMARDPLDEGLVASCSRAVREQLDLLRKAENDLFTMQRDRGELIPRTEVREDWRTLLAALRQMRRRMADNTVATLSRLGLFSPEQLAHVAHAVETERDREDQLLRGSVHWRRSEHVSPASHPSV